MRHSRTAARYDNRRRAQQAQENRARIVRAAVELLGGQAADFTVPDVARRAGVSVPTVYRNFPSREALVEAVDAEVNRRAGAPEWPSRLEDLPATLAGFHAYFAGNQAMMRAAMRTRVGREMVHHGKRARDRLAMTALWPATKHLSPEEARAVAAVIRVLAGAEAWAMMADRFGLAPEVSGAAVAWATRALLDALAKDRAAGRTTLALPKKRKGR